jgi:hypothetical protein
MTLLLSMVLCSRLQAAATKAKRQTGSMCTGCTCAAAASPHLQVGHDVCECGAAGVMARQHDQQQVVTQLLISQPGHIGGSSRRAVSSMISISSTGIQ